MPLFPTIYAIPHPCIPVITPTYLFTCWFLQFLVVIPLEGSSTCSFDWCCSFLLHSSYNEKLPAFLASHSTFLLPHTFVVSTLFPMYSLPYYFFILYFFTTTTTFVLQLIRFLIVVAVVQLYHYYLIPVLFILWFYFQFPI